MTIEHTEVAFTEVVAELKDIASFFIERGYPVHHATDLANDAAKHKFNLNCKEQLAIPGLMLPTAPAPAPAPTPTPAPVKYWGTPSPVQAEEDPDIIDVTEPPKQRRRGKRDKLAEEAARLAEGLYMPTEIGKKFNLSATMINRLLVSMGFQTKNKVTGHTLTEKGRRNGGTTRQYPGSAVAGKRIVWDERIFDLVEAELNKA
jgi:hypothetical protein